MRGGLAAERPAAQPLAAALALALAFGITLALPRACGPVQRTARLPAGVSARAEDDLGPALPSEGRDVVGRRRADLGPVRQRLASSMRAVHEASESVQTDAGQAPQDVVLQVRRVGDLPGEIDPATRARAGTRGAR